MSELEHVPLELLYTILSYLPLNGVYKLGACSKTLYAFIHGNENLWRFKLTHRHGIHYLRQDQDQDGSKTGLDTDKKALIADPSLQGCREVFLIYSEEFGSFLRRLRSNRNELGTFLKSLIPRSWGITTINYLARVGNYDCLLFQLESIYPSPKLTYLANITLIYLFTLI